MALKRDQILAADDLKRETVPVPEWGGEVIVRSLTAGERDAFEASVFTVTGKQAKQNLTNIRAKLVSLCVVGDDGERLFTDADVAALGKKSASAVDRIFTVAQQLNGLSKTDVEALEKNSESVPADAS